jgi:uncharacterized protein with PIN domain
MLGTMCKYLRFLGYDVYYPDDKMSDSEIIKLAKEEGRVLLTRDKELCRKSSNAIFIHGSKIEEQFKELKIHVKIQEDQVLTRCSICNTTLVHANKEEVSGKVPTKIYELHTDFYYCEKCKKYYWYGSHTKNILEKIKKLVNN